MAQISRRVFVLQAAATATALPLAGELHAGDPLGGAKPEPPDRQREPVDPKQATLRWLDGSTPVLLDGVTWGVPWGRGVAPAGQTFSLKSSIGQALPIQTWPLAYWPDGSLKWTAHATAGDEARIAERFVLAFGEPAPPAKAVTIREADDAIEVETGVIRCRVPRRGTSLLSEIARDGRPIARDACLVCLRQDGPDPAQRESFTSNIDKVTLERSGAVRAVVRIDGKHASEAGREWLPFTVRLYFYAGAQNVRILHTFVYDGDEHKDFLAGLGLRFSVPLRDRPQDRHVRFVGADGGMWAEAVRTLTGLRRRTPPEMRHAQVDGKPTPADAELPGFLRGGRMEMIPAWGDFTLTQPCADGFTVRKRTKPGHGWVAAGAGTRAAGVGYVGGVSGGVAFGLRDFWQRHPTQLDVRGAAGEQADVTLWLYSPEAQPMDLRFYHDGLALDSHDKQLEALEVTYEDYEPGFGTPHGVARTSEMTLCALPATPSRQTLLDIARAVQAPPLLVCRPERYHAAGVFGAWSLPDRASPAKTRIEDQLAFLFDFYRKQVEQHRWYGFWDYGDVMHTYDPDRHTWRYDVGGYAWANSELSPDLWLWYSFLRTGRSDVFRTAEAMTRHTGEVDVHHLGRFAGLGSRHNVQHWGCSAKQHRISSAIYRRFYYYLTADERIGDLLRELRDAERTLLTLDPLRKVRTEPYEPKPRALSILFGTDWGSLAAAWLTEWERTGDAKYRDKLVAGMRSIGAMAHGFFTAGATFDPETGVFTDDGRGRIAVLHLNSLFGLPELCAELITLFGEDAAGFERVWLQYCELYNAGKDEQAAALGRGLGRLSQTGAHSRLTAYAAWRKRDPQLAARAWQEFLSERSWPKDWYSRETTRVDGPAALNPVDEAPRISTNEASQWALAAIANLALIPESLP